MEICCERNSWQGLCRTRPTDMIFIIDSSRSVRPHEFEQVKVFVSKVIESLDIGQNATRVGVVNYASTVKNEFPLKAHFTKASLLRAVSQIQPLSTGTMTGLAIHFAANVAFSGIQGARTRSSEVSKIAIIVTDGRPQDLVQEAATRAKESGIEFFAIGVGRAELNSLREIASEPLEEHLDYVESYSAIEKLSKKFQEAFCVADLCASGDHDCEHICLSIPGSYKCACNEGFTLKPDGKTCGTCSSGGVDLAFVIDGSKSVRPENFELVKKFINQVIDTLEVGEQSANVALIQYSSSVRTEFPLNKYKTSNDIKAAVKNMEYMERGTMTGMALKHLTENVFIPSEGARANVPKVAIVFTDGRSQDYINDYAQTAKDQGIKMFAVGVGNALEEELRIIASDPVKDHYHYTADFKTMNKIADKLQVKICVEPPKKDPCACESLVEFQTKVEKAMKTLTSKHILLYQLIFDPLDTEEKP
ncbi:cartilage matrix protein [Callorhinchus milii]|uniref:cartilage matrix protein n=1 Tax=Callorhinchus milii TaxID=7868 RepID=UPI0004575808|nr:cartilage matrix protein [Callorhinchus milii]|eukprot:gi/632954848/ref/XP_007893179.1/ PREDICTED: cartilage matrix protein [Callorhinchus milii]